jgi:lysophospholipase L1-like esterase
VERYENELRSRDGNVAIIAIGINDSCFVWDESNNLVSTDSFVQNLKKIQELSEKLHLEKLIFVWLTRVDESLACPYPWSSTGKSYKNHIIEKYDNAIQDFCDENSIPYIDMREVVSSEYLPDWLHPDALWNKKMAERILPELKKILHIQ